MNLSDIEYVNSISLEDYNHLRKAVGWGEIAARQAQIGINNSAYKVSAVFKGKTVGMARVVSDGGYTALISDVIILPEFQGKGIGKTMINMVIDYIKGTILEGEKVFINLMAAKGRESFYKQFGFIERPNDKFGPGMIQWISK